MLSKASRLLTISVAAILMVSCGSEEKQFVKGFTYDVTKTDTVDFEVEFNNDLTLNTEFHVPVMGYGAVRFTPNMKDRGVKLGTSLHLDAFSDPQIVSLSKTRKLPNQESMSPYVEKDVARLWIKATDQVATSVYFGFEPNKFYLGTAVELSFLDSDFPAGLVITQRLLDLKNRPLGVVTLYGPKMNGNAIEAPGGIFVMTNVSDLVQYAKDDLPTGFAQANGSLNKSSGLLPDHETYVNLEEYRKKEKLLQLLMLYRDKAKEAGLGD